MLTVAQGCAACALAALLVVAGTIKLLRPGYAAGSLRRVSARAQGAEVAHVVAAARVLGGLECLVGSALVLVAGPASVAVAAASVYLFAGFVIITQRAVRRGIACGCFGSLSDGPAGRGELARRVVLLAIAIGVLVARLHDAARAVPVLVAIAVVAGAVVAGVVIARRPGSAASVVGMGTARELVDPAGRAARGRGRTRILTSVRADPDVRAVQQRIGAELDWDHARVRVGRQKAVVVVDGTDATLRVVVASGQTIPVAETPDAMVTSAGGLASTTPKA
jgi:hypothetical protein